MADINSADPEDLVTCPYNKAHLIRRKKFQLHLIKCRSHHPDSKLLKCPFNLCHMIPEQEYSMHIGSCPDRAIITNYKNIEEDNKRKATEVSTQPKNDSEEEDWDNSEEDTKESTKTFLESKGYDPNKKINSNDIILPLNGYLPAQRRKIREDQLKNFESKRSRRD
ncbi:gametocyte-specific factor 1 homolog [Condylostylus longicornis]|uniref:gametocyte-specific factor 1 homolog n=1 Tax=Condylostylus longicornis TaxID=2530218 RepID=UPI00244DB7CD|nr:gametocyte-specific factor 1 homolog [Condylostylus longicornis]